MTLRIIDMRTPDGPKQLRSMYQALHLTRLRAKTGPAQQVDDIIAEVGGNGDTAVIEYTRKFDGLQLSADKLRVSADELEAARKKAAQAEKAAQEKQTALTSLQQRLQELEEQGQAGAVPLDTRETLKGEIAAAEAGAEKAHRRAVKAKVKAEDAAKAVDALNPTPRSEEEAKRDEK